MRKNQPKILYRYAYPDRYTLLELNWKFQNSDTGAKIAILQEIKSSTGSVSKEIAELVINDKDVVVRQWLAKNGSYLDENIQKKLLNDPDEYVKASAYENSDIGGILGPDVDSFNKCDPVARLAIMRRENVRSDLIEKIFDFNDKELKISSVEERADLIKAYLTNSAEVSESRKDIFDHIDGLDAAFSSLQYRKIWDLISQWPTEFSWLKRLVYLYLGNDNENKVEIYKTSPDVLKLAIVQGCTGEGSHDDEIIKLAMKDKDDFVKREAYSKASWFQIDKTEINQLLIGDNKEIIAGIGENKNIPLSIREQAVARLRDLGDDLGVYLLSKELGEVEKGDQEEYKTEEDEGVNASLFSFDKKRNKKSYWGYGWTVLINFIVLGVILVLFSTAYDAFQTRIYAILVIIYLSIDGFLSQYTLFTTNFALGLDGEFKRLRRLLKNTPDETELEEADESRQKIDKATKKMYINSFFMFIAYLIALWNLLRTL